MRPRPKKGGKLIVVAAGTSDLPVAEEAAMTAELYGNQVERVYDVGVAGIHRLCIGFRLWKTRMPLSQWQVWRGHWSVWSVVWWPVRSSVYRRVIGYGANFGGLAALLSMLNSCASGVSVVNIDNGFGAGVLASKINKQAIKK